MKYPITHASIEITDEPDFHYSYMYIHRKGRKNVSCSYSAYDNWPKDQQARRLLRFFRFINALAKRMMEAER